MFFKELKYGSTLFKFLTAGIIYNLIALSLLGALINLGLSIFWSGFLSSFTGIILSYYMNKAYVFKLRNVAFQRRIYFFLYNLLVIFAYSTIITLLENIVDLSILVVAPLVILIFAFLNFYFFKKILGSCY